MGSALQGVALLLYFFFDGLASLYVISALFGLFQGGIVPSYAIIVREYFPPREAGTRIGLVIMATLFGMALGGWMSGAIFDYAGSYRAAFANGLAWNLLNVTIATWLLLRSRTQDGLRVAARGQRAASMAKSSSRHASTQVSTVIQASRFSSPATKVPEAGRAAAPIDVEPAIAGGRTVALTTLARRSDRARSLHPMRIGGSHRGVMLDCRREGRSHGGPWPRAIIRNRLMTKSEADQRSGGEGLFSHHDPTPAGIGRSLLA